MDYVWYIFPGYSSERCIASKTCFQDNSKSIWVRLMLLKVCCGQFVGESCVGSPSSFHSIYWPTRMVWGGGAPWSFHKVLDSDDRESCRLQRNFLKIYSGNQDSWKAQQLWKKVLARWTWLIGWGEAKTSDPITACQSRYFFNGKKPCQGRIK